MPTDEHTCDMEVTLECNDCEGTGVALFEMNGQTFETDPPKVCAECDGKGEITEDCGGEFRGEPHAYVCQRCGYEIGPDDAT